MKNLKNLSRRGLALLLTLVMCLGMLQLTVFAIGDEPGAFDDPDEIGTVSQTETEAPSDTEDEPEVPATSDPEGEPAGSEDTEVENEPADENPVTDPEDADENEDEDEPEDKDEAEDKEETVEPDAGTEGEGEGEPTTPEVPEPEDDKDDEDNKDKVVEVDIPEGEIPLNEKPFDDADSSFDDDGPSLLGILDFFGRPNGGGNTTTSGQDVYVFVNVATEKMTVGKNIEAPSDKVAAVKAAYDEAAAKVKAAQDAKDAYDAALKAWEEGGAPAAQELQDLKAELTKLEKPEGTLPEVPPQRNDDESWFAYRDKVNAYNELVEAYQKYAADVQRINDSAETLLKENSNLESLYNTAKKATEDAQAAIGEAEKLAEEYNEAVATYNAAVQAANRAYLESTGDGNFFDGNETVEDYNVKVAEYNADHTAEQIVAQFNADPYIQTAANAVNKDNANRNIWYTIGMVNIDALTTDANNGLAGYGAPSVSNGKEYNDYYIWERNTQTFKWEGNAAVGGRKTLSDDMAAVGSDLSAKIATMMSNGTGRLGNGGGVASPAKLAGTNKWVLKVSGGATGYPNVTKTVWHLDGYLYAQDLATMDPGDVSVTTKDLTVEPFGYMHPEFVPGEAETYKTIPLMVDYEVKWLEKGTDKELDSDTRAGGDGKTVEVDDTDKEREFKGYTFAEEAEHVLEGVLNGSITKLEEMVVLKLYFTRDQGTYTVEYYKDNEKVDTDTVSGDLTDGQVPVKVDDINTSDKYGEDYMFEKCEPTTIPNTVDNGDVIKVYYVKDENKDQVPDRYQVKVTFEVVNGQWDEGGTEKIVKFVTLETEGKYAEDGEATLEAPTVGSKPNEGFTTGKWSEEPPKTVTKADNNATYTYTYAPKSGYSVVYLYDDTVGNAPDGAPTGADVAVGTSVDLSETLKNGFSTVKKDDANYVLVSEPATLAITVDADSTKNIIYVYYEKDVLVDPVQDPNGDPNNGDGVPDKYQIQVTFKVVNGAWNNDSKDDVVTVATLKTEGKYDVNGKATLTAPGVGQKPNEGYKEGSWDETPPDIANSSIAGKVYTYTYVSASSGSESTGSYTVTVNYVSDKGETVAPSQTSAAINQGSEYDVTDLANRTFEGWKYVRTDGAVRDTSNSDVTVNVVYTRDANNDNIADKYQIVVTFHVVNGDWNDGAKGAKVVYLTKLDANGEPAEDGTATLTADQFPAVGDKPASGYRASGSWSPAKAEIQLTGDAEYTFTYTRRSGGSSSRPSRPTTPDDTDPPVVDIPDEEPPLVDVPDVDTPVEPPVEPPVVDIPDEEPPLVDIPDEEPPLVDIPDEEPPLVDIPDEEPPLVDVPDEDNVEPPVVEIPENTVPLSDVPRTGDSSGIWTVLALLSAAGLLGLTVYGRKKREEV